MARTVRAWLVSVIVALTSVLWATPASGARDACMVGCVCEDGSELDALDDCGSCDQVGAHEEDAPGCWLDCRGCACTGAPSLAPSASAQLPTCLSPTSMAGFALRRRDPPAATPTDVFRPPRRLSLV